MFDVAVASEIIEHVANPGAFLGHVSSVVAPGGSAMVSTINRTPRAYALAVVAAERVLGLAPPGTHAWEAFIQPEELVVMGEAAGLSVRHTAGMWYDPVRNEWGLGTDVGVNYVMHFVKEG